MRPKALIKILRTTFVHFLLEMGQTAIIFCMVLWAMQMANQIRNLLFCNLQLYHAIRRQDLHIWNTKISLLMIYEMNHTWTAEMKWKWRNDRRSSECNLRNCVKMPEKKKFRTSMGLNPWPHDYRCDALPTELWSHWRWEQVNCGFICSRERNEC